MTSPYIQKRNRASLGGQPLVEPTSIAPPTTLMWEQQDQKRLQEQDALKQAIAARQQPIASTLGTQTFSNRHNIIKSVGETATNGTVASVAKQQADAMAAFQQQQAGLSANAQAATLADGSAATPITQSQGVYSGADAQIAQWARAGGWDEKDIPMAIAIVKAESGGSPTALNTSNRNGSTDTGLFQINSIHSSWTKGMNLNDPVQNSKAALKIFRDSGSTWKPWSTFNNGAYNKFLKQPASYSPAPNLLAKTTTSTGSGLRQVAVNTAMQAIGLPYVWGGNNINRNDNIRDGVDCSGLVQQVYKSLGINMPRTAHEQSKSILGTRVAINQLQQGDLVAWQGGWRGPNYVGHIAIYQGNGRIIEAYTSGKPIRERALKPGEKAFGVHIKFPGE